MEFFVVQFYYQGQLLNNFALTHSLIDYFLFCVYISSFNILKLIH